MNMHSGLTSRNTGPDIYMCNWTANLSCQSGSNRQCDYPKLISVYWTTLFDTGNHCIIVHSVANKITSTAKEQKCYSSLTYYQAHWRLIPNLRVCNVVRVTSVDTWKTVMFEDLSNFAGCNKDLNIHKSENANASWGMKTERSSPHNKYKRTAIHQCGYACKCLLRLEETENFASQ